MSASWAGPHSPIPLLPSMSSPYFWLERWDFMHSPDFLLRSHAVHISSLTRARLAFPLSLLCHSIHHVEAQLIISPFPAPVGTVFLAGNWGGHLWSPSILSLAARGDPPAVVLSPSLPLHPSCHCQALASLIPWTTVQEARCPQEKRKVAGVEAQRIYT